MLNYIFQLLFSDIDDQLYYQIIMEIIYSSQVYLFISIYKIIIDIIKIKKMKRYDNSLAAYKFCLIAIILLFPFDKLLNFNPKIIILIQNIVIIICVYIFYKQLILPTSTILKKSNQKIKQKIPIIKILNLLLNFSFYFISAKIIIKLILILFVDKTIQDYLEMPLNSIIYLKFFDFTLVYLLILKFDQIGMNKNINDDSFDKLKV